MSKVAIVTDSTTSLPDDVAKDLEIVSVPLQVIWGETTYLDGITLKLEEFYTRLATAKVIPTTSQPSPAAFHEVYVDLLNRGYDILSIHISSKLSGTVDSATQAKAMINSSRIEIIDSRLTSMALGFVALDAAKAAKKGASLSECKAIAESTLQRSGAIFVVNTLEFLHRGGRIGGAAAFLGTTLDLKPILELRDGKIEAIERVRSANKAVDRMISIVVKKIALKNVRLSVVHGNAPEAAQNLSNKLTAAFLPEKIQEISLAGVSPVIGTHTGPGVLGIMYSYQD